MCLNYGVLVCLNPYCWKYNQIVYKNLLVVQLSPVHPGTKLQNPSVGRHMTGWQLGEHPREQFVPKYPSLQAKNKVKNIPIISKKVILKIIKKNIKQVLTFIHFLVFVFVVFVGNFRKLIKKSPYLLMSVLNKIPVQGKVKDVFNYK